MNAAKKIIIFDDDEDILSICTYILQEQGWEVIGFTDCNEPEEKVCHILPDVILMDNWIPASGGIIATQLLKNNPALRHIPVIYFSANNDLPALAKAAGAETWLYKPFDIADLDSAIRSVYKSAG